MEKMALTHLRALEAESIHILREVVAEFSKPRRATGGKGPSGPGLRRLSPSHPQVFGSRLQTSSASQTRMGGRGTPCGLAKTRRMSGRANTDGSGASDVATATTATSMLASMNVPF